jgi:hypothetical protein
MPVLISLAVFDSDRLVANGADQHIWHSPSLLQVTSCLSSGTRNTVTLRRRLRDPPMPEAALGLSPQTSLDLAQPQPSRKVLPNVLGFRLARCHLQTGRLPSSDTLTDRRFV